MSRADFNLELRGKTLFIEGERRVEREFRGVGHYTIQSSYGSFRCVVPLPVSVNADKVVATYRNGVLRVVLPKIIGEQARRLTVKVNDGN